MATDPNLQEPGRRVCRIDNSRCRLCAQCAAVCPMSCIGGGRGKPMRIDAERCDGCGLCIIRCLYDAILPKG